jgi:hypothetical protein
MNILHSKIPFLPDTWTWARGAKYAAKLGVFVLVPGLHQVILKRWLFGTLLMTLYFGSEVILANLPLHITSPNFPAHGLAENLSVAARIISWLLLILDLGKLETRNLKPGPLLVSTCIAGLYFIPPHFPGNLTLSVETKNDLCPVFCQYDVVEYDLSFPGKAKLKNGDYVVVYVFKPDLLLTQILAVPSKEICPEFMRMKRYLSYDHFFCDPDGDGGFSDPWLVYGGPEPKMKSLDGRDVSLVYRHNINGVRPRKIGNIRDYFILTEGISDFVGHALLTIYKLTDINLFKSSTSL